MLKEKLFVTFVVIGVPELLQLCVQFRIIINEVDIVFIFFLIFIIFEILCMIEMLRDDFLRVKLRVSTVLCVVEIIAFLPSRRYREDLINLILIIFVVFVIVAVYHVYHMLRTLVRVCHVLIDSHEDLHIATLKILVIGAFINLAEFTSPVGLLSKLLALVRRDDTRI